MKILLALIILLVFPVITQAAPFLICDPQVGINEYVVTYDGIEEIVSYNENHSSGSVILKDLAGITEGNHTIDVKAVNVWGESATVNFPFSKILPTAVTGIAIAP